MNILLVGNGQHANKRIIPSLIQLDLVSKIDIVFNEVIHHKVDDSRINYFNKNDKDNSLDSSYDLIIYATRPDIHLENFYEYYDFSNKHLIEKPISSNFNFLKEVSFEKKYKNKKVFESLMYFHHPVVKKIQTITSNEIIKSIKCSFKVPHADFEHYRYKKKFGGGSLLDQGIYPISLISSIFGENLKLIDSNLHYNSDFEVDLGGIAKFKNNSIQNITAEWGLGMEYENYLEINSLNFQYVFPFIFSKNESLSYEYYLINEKNEKLFETLGKSDQFKNMYTDILDSKLNNFFYSNFNELTKRYSFISKIFDT